MGSSLDILGQDNSMTKSKEIHILKEIQYFDHVPYKIYKGST